MVSGGDGMHQWIHKATNRAPPIRSRMASQLDGDGTSRVRVPSAGASGIGPLPRLGKMPRPHAGCLDLMQVLLLLLLLLQRVLARVLAGGRRLRAACLRPLKHDADSTHNRSACLPILPTPPDYSRGGEACPPLFLTKSNGVQARKKGRLSALASML